MGRGEAFLAGGCPTWLRSLFSGGVGAPLTGVDMMCGCGEKVCTECKSLPGNEGRSGALAIQR